MLTDDQYVEFARALDALSDKYFEGQYDDFIRAQAELARRDSARQPHDQVKGCLDGMADLLEHAALNFEISFK